MKKMRYVISALCISILLISNLVYAGRISGRTKGDRNENTGGSESSESYVQEEPDEYEPELITISSEEEKRIREHILEAVEPCWNIYEQADKGNADNVVLPDQIIEKLARRLADNGYTVSCGGNICNMQNEELLDVVLKNASAGEEAEAEFFHITKSGVFEWRRLEFKKGEMVMTCAGAGWSRGEESQKLRISYMEKQKVYDWQYTEKGWLIIEASKSKNHEMDMHSMFRVLPLPQECREYCSRYIVPVSYMGNNLFLTDWDEASIDKVVFNDVFEFLYTMETGKKYEEQEYPDGVPKELYESIITSYFPISASKLEQFPGYSEEKQTYSWEAMGCGTVIPQPQPFPEVVKVTEQEDGTVILTVDAGLLQAGTDRAFTHEVRIKPDDEGNMQYIGNHVLESEENKMPGYMPRMSYQ